MRTGFAGVIGTAAALALAFSVVLTAGATSSSFACVDMNNNQVYLSGDNGASPYWYTQIATSNSNGPLYSTQGGKSNLSIEGHPSTWDNTTQHVNAFVSSAENPNHCVNPGFPRDCHVQVGWMTGSFAKCGGGYVNTGSAIDVYAEIYDDSSTDPSQYNIWCFASTFGSAPTNASYDARYYSTLSNGLHRYQVYFEVPGSNNIQNLAYGDFKDQYSYESAGGEIWAEPVTTANPRCPTLGDTPHGYWDQVGEYAANTFAENLQLYTGSWVDWSTAYGAFDTNNSPYTKIYLPQYTNDVSRFKIGGPI